MHRDIFVGLEAFGLCWGAWLICCLWLVLGAVPVVVMTTVLIIAGVLVAVVLLVFALVQMHIIILCM